MITTPIVLICFNRPVITKKVFNKIKEHKPSKLFLIMDGPRYKNSEDVKKIHKVKKIISKVDWNCRVYKNFSKNNLGLKKRVISGLNWVFKKVDKAIILEDDCYPSSNFFKFCEDMLKRYEKNKSINVITGNNFQKKPINKDSYYFSKYSHIWGWATWRRTWNLFDDNDKSIERFLGSAKYKKLNKTYDEQDYWKNMHSQIKTGSLKSWAFYLLINIWKNNGVTVTPNYNLVLNIGIDNFSGTNKNDPNLKISLSKKDFKLPLIHPKKIKINEKADLEVFFSIYKKNLKTKLKNRIKKMINSLK